MIQEVSARYGFPIPEKVEVTQWLEGGEVLTLGNEEFEVRFAPAIRRVMLCSITKIMPCYGQVMYCSKARLAGLISRVATISSY